MTEIKVSLPSMLHHCADGRAEIDVKADSLDGVFAALFTAYPQLRSHLFNDRGELRPHVLCLLGEDNVRWLDRWDAPLTAPVTLTILQAVSGG